MSEQTKTKYKGQRLGNWELTSLALSVPADVMGVSITSRTVLLEICFQQTFSDKGPQGDWYIFNADIAMAVGVATRSVTRSTAELEEAGLLTVHRGENRYAANAYSVNRKLLEQLALQQAARVKEARAQGRQNVQPEPERRQDAQSGVTECPVRVDRMSSQGRQNVQSGVTECPVRVDRLSNYLEANLEATGEAVLDTNLEASDDGTVLADSINANATDEQGPEPSASSLAEVCPNDGSDTSPSSSVEINTADSLEELPDSSRIVELGAVGDEIRQRLQAERKRKPWNQDTPVPEFLSGEADAKIEMFRQAKRLPLSGNNLTDDKLAFCINNGVEAVIK